MTTALSCLATRREWFKTENGAWASRPWTKQARASYIANGGYFTPGAHDLCSPPEHFHRDPQGAKCNYRCQLHVGSRGYAGGSDE